MVILQRERFRRRGKPHQRLCKRQCQFEDVKDIDNIFKRHIQSILFTYQKDRKLRKVINVLEMYLKSADKVLNTVNSGG